MSKKNYPLDLFPKKDPDNNFPKLVFKNNEANEHESLGHAGIETYTDAPCSSVARECGQNSADVFLKRPVKLSFRVLDVDKKDFPSLNDFKNVVNACSRKKNNEKEIDFFKRANTILNNETITILEISDYNTKGARGPSTKGNPFHALVKGRGVNVKESEDSGGSFGIGKNAAFAVSDLQTVFYSTLFLDNNGEKNFLAQGKSILTSHEDDQGNPKEATGYWGFPNYEPITKIENVPKWMQREEIGTSIFCVGFSKDDWQSLMKASVVANFFAAIHRGEMMFEIDGSVVDKNNISEIFTDEKLKDRIKGRYLEESFRFSEYLYECLTSSETKEKSIDVENLGQISIKLLQKDGLPKRIAIIRNGMYITDTLKNFGEPLSNFPNQEDFVAIIEPRDSDVSAFLKKLENPNHNGFSAERIKDSEKRIRSKKAIKDLVKKVREIIKENTYIEAEESIDLEELQEFFPRTSNEDNLRDPKANEDDLSSIKFKAGKSRIKPNQEISDRDEEGDEGGSSTLGNGGVGDNGGGHGTGVGSGSGGSGNSGGSITVTLNELRNLIPENKSSYYRDIFFTPNHTGEVSLTLFASGVDEKVELKIAEIDGSAVRVQNASALVEAGKRNKLSIKFMDSYDGPIKVSACTKTIEGE
jgi:hypothetical protein